MRTTSLGSMPSRGIRAARAQDAAVAKVSVWEELQGAVVDQVQRPIVKEDPTVDRAVVVNR
jgi:hypothetical protein